MTSSSCGKALKEALKMLEFSTTNVLGTEGARVYQRHVNTAFRRRFGIQALFATINWSDSRSPLVVLIFDGVDGTMKLTEPIPAMPSMTTMKEILGSDPIGHAIFYRTMMNLFVEVVMGAGGPGFCEPLHADGVAARTYSAAGGLYGGVLAGYGPEEEQGRGSRHAHMAWWFVKNIYDQLFKEMKEQKETGKLRETVNAWAERVKQAAASMQFSSVHEMLPTMGIVTPQEMAPLRRDQTGVPEDSEDDNPEQGGKSADGGAERQVRGPQGDNDGDVPMPPADVEARVGEAWSVWGVPAVMEAMAKLGVAERTLVGLLQEQERAEAMNDELTRLTERHAIMARVSGLMEMRKQSWVNKEALCEEVRKAGAEVDIRYSGLNKALNDAFIAAERQWAKQIEERVPRLPVSSIRQKQLKVDGLPENDVAGTSRPLLHVTAPEPQPNKEKDKEYFQWPLTNTVLCRNPEYLWHPPYAVTDDGRWARGESTEAVDEAAAKEEAVAWGWACAKHGRDVVAQTHIHKCTDTCFKYGAVCRFDFYQVLEFLVKSEDDEDARPRLKKVFRRGKALQDKVRVMHEEFKRGKISFVRTHPDHGDTSCFALCMVQCNFDFQLIWRLPPPLDEREPRMVELALEAAAEATGDTIHRPGAKAKEFPSIDDIVTKVVERVMASAGSPPAADDASAAHELQKTRALVERVIERLGTSDVVSQAASGEAYSFTLIQPHNTCTADQRRIKLKAHPEFDRAKRGPRTAHDQDEQVRREVNASIMECVRDCNDAAFYSGSYATKAHMVLGPVVQAQRDGVDRFVKQHGASKDEKELQKDKQTSARSEASPPSDNADTLSHKEQAIGLIVRLQTAAERQQYEALITSVTIDLYGQDAVSTHEPWTLFTGFTEFAARKASPPPPHPRASASRFDFHVGKDANHGQLSPRCRPCGRFEHKYGVASPDLQSELLDSSTADTVTFLLDDCPIKDPTQLEDADAAVVTTNQKDDYLHRGADPLRCLPLLLYSEYVTRTDLPKGCKPGELRHPYYAFSQHYELYWSHCQKFDPCNRPPKVAVLQGPQIKAASEAPDTNARQKLTLLEPFSCDGADGTCDKYAPFECLCCANGFRPLWVAALARHQRRADKARAYCDKHRIYPSLAAFWLLGEAIDAAHAANSLAPKKRGQALPDADASSARRRLLRWYASLRIVEYAQNLEDVAEAGRRPRRKLDASRLDDPEINETARDAKRATNAVYGDERERAREDGKAVWPIPLDDVEKFASYSRFTPTSRASKARDRATEVLNLMEWKHASQRVRPQKGYRPGTSMDEVIAAQTRAKEAATAEWEKARAERKNEESGQSATSVPRHPSQKGSVQAGLHTFSQEARQLVHQHTLNRSQRHGAALQIDAILKRLSGNMEAQVVMIEVGPGGSGKTHAQNKVVRPMAVKARGMSGERGLCQANAAARILGSGAMTCHAFIHHNFGEKVSRARSKRYEAAVQEAGNLLSLTIDEFSMIAMDLFDTIEEWCALGNEDIRETVRDARDAKGGQSAARLLFGGIPAVCLLGDFYQLGPVLAQGAASRHIEEARKFETEQAWKKYEKIDTAIVLREVKRFKSKVLETITNDWRAGRKSDDETWEKFTGCFDGAMKYYNSKTGEDERWSNPGFLDGAFISDTWQAPLHEQSSCLCASGASCGSPLRAGVFRVAMRASAGAWVVRRGASDPPLSLPLAIHAARGRRAERAGAC